MMCRKIILLMVISMVFNTARAQQLNTLTSQEENEGWQLLFNGRDMKGWHSYAGDKPGKAWQIEDHSISLNKNDKSTPPDYADLVTDKEFEDFELVLEWKIVPCGNSGIMFYVHESPEFKETYETGPEMQIVDLSCSPDTRVLLHRAGDLYGLVPADTIWVGNGGEWNQYRIRSVKGHLQLFVNGHLVTDTYLWDANWKTLIARSKFAAMPSFGSFRKGHISLQGTENGRLWFRNIKIRML